MNTKRTLTILVMVLLVILAVTQFASAATPLGVTRSIKGLPWKSRQSWKYSQDTHGSVNNGFDFGTPDGKAGAVYAVDSGTVKAVTDCYIVIRRSDGLWHGYQHVAKAANIKVGSTVTYQTYLGTTSLCGGSTGHHVHFWLYDDNTQSNQKGFNPIGVSFAGWVLTKERDESEPLAPANWPDPKSGYDYVMRKGTAVACAGTTMQKGRNICTTNLLTNP